MIKTLIADFCLNALFKEIEKNLYPIKYKECYYAIYNYYDGYVFHKCTVLKYDIENNIKYITFYYEEMTSNDDPYNINIKKTRRENFQHLIFDK